MYEGGRRLRWGFQIKRLFGAELFNHVQYYDVVGSSLSGVLQTVVLTDDYIYIYPNDAKTRPDPFCNLIDIKDIGSDHETPETFRGNSEYNSHHIFFTYKDQVIHLYTFESGTDLFWRLTNAVDGARRLFCNKKTVETSVENGQIELVTLDGKTIPILNYYMHRFNQISSHVLHAHSHSERMKMLKHLIELSKVYFPVRILFFQASPLISYLLNALHLFSNSHTIPATITSTRLEQIHLIEAILGTFRHYLNGISSVKDATRLVTYNHGEHFTLLVKSIINIEWFILSQPSRATYYLKSVPKEEQENYLLALQDIEETSVSLLTQLYSLSIITERQSKLDDITNNLFFDLMKQNQKQFIGGCFHTIVFMAIQLGYALEGMKKVTDLMGQSLYDHLWAIVYFASTFPPAAKMLRTEFATEFDTVLTIERCKHYLSKDFILLPEIQKALTKIREIINMKTTKYNLYENLPVQFY